jgi:hypothetical protein
VTPVPRVTSLRETSLPALLRESVRARRTGVLRLTRGGVRKSLYLSEGRLVFAASSDPDDRLGERLLAKGLISLRAYEDSVLALQAGKRQGTILVENGAIRSRELVAGVNDQVRGIILSLFTWDEAEVELLEGPLPSREVIVLQMSTPDLLREGIHRIEAWSRIRAGAGPPDQTYRLAPMAGSVPLDPGDTESTILATLEADATLDEICAAVQGPDFLTCRSVWALWTMGVVDRVPQDAPTETDLARAARVKSDLTGPNFPGRELDLLNDLQRFLFDLLSFEIRDGARTLLLRALARTRDEYPAVLDGVSLDEAGAIDAAALRRNALSPRGRAWRQALGRLLELEEEEILRRLGARKTAIIQDGLVAMKMQQEEAALRGERA